MQKTFSLFHRFRKELIDFKQGRMIFIIATGFGVLYHLAFLILFRLYEVYPMFYYNFVSIGVFLFCFLSCHRCKKLELLFIPCYIEVIVHQVLADLLLGSYADFHYFILCIGIVPILAFGHKFKTSLAYGVASFILFILLESCLNHRLPPYDLPYVIITTIKILNISLTAMVILFGLFVYSFIVNSVEKSLQIKIEEKTREIQSKNEEFLRLQGQIIVSLSSLVENRDTDTGMHIQRTQAYVNLIANQAFKEGIYKDIIDDEFINNLYQAAPMHDIGKIVVPDAILKKPGKLTPEEFDVMKLHTTEGRRIIEETLGITTDDRFLKMAGNVAACHHEKWDGTGYPEGLREQEIPLSARIMAIADVFDALVSKRCYKEPMSSELAFCIIEKDAGKHFDPVLVKLFLQIKEKVLRVMETYKN